MTATQKKELAKALTLKIERMKEQRLWCDCEATRLIVELARVQRKKPCSASEQRKVRMARKAKHAAA